MRLLPAFALALALAAAAPAGAQEIPEPAGPDADADAGEAAGVHIVRRGDTLWDLAARFLSDPLRWPAIFELNPAVVEDPHWIYPGERLRIPGAVARVDRVRIERAEDYLRNLDAAEAEGGRYPAGSIFRRPRDGGSGLSTLLLDERPPLAVVTADDFRRAPVLVGAGELGPEGTTVRVMEGNPLGLRLPTAARQHVEVVIDLGALRPALGDTLKAVRRVRREGDHGGVVVPKALLEVNRLWADSARATVVRIYGDYEVGDPVIELAPRELDPAARLGPVETGLAARVIAFEVPQVLLGSGEFVFLDAGGEDGVRLGDEFAVFPRDEAGAIQADVSDALAILRVVRVTSLTSTARVVSVRDPGMRPGDPVRLVGRVSPPAPAG